MDIFGQFKKTNPSFTSAEKAVLLLLVKKYEKYIEDRNSNTAITRFNKNKAWLVIQEEFNKAVKGSNRDVLNLRSKYIDMKKKHVQVMKTKHNRHFDEDSRRNILHEMIEESKKDDFFIDDEFVEIKNEPIDDAFENTNPTFSGVSNSKDETISSENGIFIILFIHFL